MSWSNSTFVPTLATSGLQIKLFATRDQPFAGFRQLMQCERLYLLSSKEENSLVFWLPVLQYLASSGNQIVLHLANNLPRLVHPLLPQLILTWRRD